MAARSGDQWDAFHVPIRSPRDWGLHSAASSSSEAMAEARAVNGVHTCSTTKAAWGIGRVQDVVNRGWGRPDKKWQLGRGLGRGTQWGVWLVGLNPTGLSELLAENNILTLKGL